MGVRLYPATKNEETLERLAGVPAGTAKRLRELRAKHRMDEPATFEEDRARSEAFYGELFRADNAHLNTYHGFDLYGWGRFRSTDTPAYRERYREYCGDLTPGDREEIVLLLQINGIDLNGVPLDHLGGVCWG